MQSFWVWSKVLQNMTTHCAKCTCCVLRIKAAVTSRGAIWVSIATNTSDALYDRSSFCSWHFWKPFSLVKFCATPTFAHVTPNVFTTHDLRNPAINDSEKKKMTDLQYDYAPKRMELQKCFDDQVQKWCATEAFLLQVNPPSPSGLQCSGCTFIIALTPRPHLIRPGELLSGTKTCILTGSFDLKHMIKMLER